MIKLHGLLLASFILTLATAAVAQDKDLRQNDRQRSQKNAANTQPAETNLPSTRVYDIRDLLLRIEDYPVVGRFASPQPPAVDKGVTVKRLNSQEERAEEIVKLVMETIEPESWRAAGGSIGAIRELSGQLIVTQTPETHSEIVSLIEQLKASRAVMVRVRADWVQLGPAELQAMLKPARKEIALREVEPTALAKFLETSPHHHAEVVGFNDQTVHVVSGPAQVVTGPESSGGEPAADEIVRGGVILQAKPIIARGSDVVFVQLYSALINLDRHAEAHDAADTQPASAGRAGTTAIEGLSTIQTSLAIPIGSVVIVGGVSLDADRNSAAKEKEYVLILQTTADPSPADGDTGIGGVKASSVVNRRGSSP